VRYQVDVRFGREYLSVQGSHITVGLKARPVKGRANRELITRLANYFKVSATQIRIVSGYTSRRKVVVVEGAGAS
jgi:uncharacterized protein (TIGR00251 family)